jgi:hypothetical protein
MPRGRSSVKAGMAVLGADMESVGLVKQVHRAAFLLDRELQRDIYVPLQLVDRVSHKLVVLSITADELNTREWSSAPI